MTTKEFLLCCGAEECCEVGQCLTKMQRFGVGDKFPDESSPSNLEKLVDELNDLMGVIELLEENNILPIGWENAHKKIAKKEKVAWTIQYAKARGVMHEDVARPS